MTENQASEETGKTRLARDYGVGMPARRAAVGLLTAILIKHQPLDDALVNSPASREMLSMAERDRGLARAIVSTAIRHKGQLDAVLDAFIDKPLPKSSGPLREILLSAACQLLFLNTPPHAAIDLAVNQAKQDRNARHFGKLANAVLRRVASEGSAIIKAQNGPRLNTPDWLWERWVKNYGEETAQGIAQANMAGAALDLTVKQDPADWAVRLNGIALDTGSVRLLSPGRVENLEGYEAGAWWVQDAAAALPARLLGDIAGCRVADLCAAPGGKSAQLAQAQAQASAGGSVTSVDSSKRRLVRLDENMARLGLKPTTVVSDAAQWMPDEPFDAVLLDAPCTGTGTLRRHPDIAHLKGPEDLKKLAALQERLLRHAITIVRPGGRLVFCTCSLEPEEGEMQIKRLLDDHKHVSLDPIRPDEVFGHDSWVSGEGYLRTLPFDLECERPEAQGIDGFFAARLTVRVSPG